MMCFESASPLLYLRAAALMALLALVGAPPSRSATVTATASGQPRPSSANAASAPGCSAALEAACAAQRSDVFKCAECAGRNERALHLAGCDNDAISAWCAGLPPPAPTAFPGSRLITAEWGTQLNEWAGKLAGQEWELCYTSFTMDKSTPTVFHTSCDRFDHTLSVAHNAGGRACDGTHLGFKTCQTDSDCRGKRCNTNLGNYTFGGFVRSFSPLPSLPSLVHSLRW